MDNPETQETLRTRHETKKKKQKNNNNKTTKNTSLKNKKINNTDHTKIPEVIACGR